MESPSERVRLKPNVEWQAVDDEIVALDLDGSAYLGVNDSGTLLWPLVAAGATEGDLARELVSAFDIEPSRASADAHAFVERLRSLALVVDDA